jgi:hypothetical protein
MMTGCVQTDYHVTINKDMSGELAYKVGLSKDFMDLAAQGGSTENPLDSMQSEYKKQGFKVKTYNKDGYQGVIASKHVKDVRKLTNIGLQGSAATQGLANDGKFTYTTKKGFLYDTVKVSAAFDMTAKTAVKEAQKVAKATGETFDAKAYETQMQAAFAMFEKQMDLTFTLTLPGKASKQNATKELGKNTYQWKLKLGEVNKLNVEAKVPHTGALAVLIGGGVVVLGGAIYLIRRRKSGEATEPEVEQEEVAVGEKEE